MNRAERRRRGFTRSRMARGGSLASAGVLLSVGLFGAYTGSPRLQRAYASGCTIANSYVATRDDSLIAALDDSSVTCIEIQGSITLTQDLPRIFHTEWNGSARESLGLTIFGSGDDTINGADYSGIRLVLDDNTQQIASDALLNISDLSLTNFNTPNSLPYNSIGNAVYAYLYGQPHDLRVTLQGVHMSDNISLLQGGALYTGTNSSGNVTSSVYTTIIDSTFRNNTGGVRGGAVMVLAEDDTAIADISNSTFSSNYVSDNYEAAGGAVAVVTRNPIGYTNAIVRSGTTFENNTATVSGVGNINNPNKARGGGLYSSGAVEVTSGATFDGNSVQATANYTEADGGAVFASGSVTVGAGSTFHQNTATSTQAPMYYGADGGAIFTSSTLTVTGSSANPVVFADDSTTRYGGAVYAYNGGSITSAIFERNSAKWGGAAFSQDIGWTFADSTIRNNDALHTGGGVYAWQGSTAFYRSAIVGNHADYTAGGVGTAGSVTFENSFVGSNSLSGGNAGSGAGIRALGDVYLRFSTVYDNSTSQGASEIAARNVTSTMSVVGNSSSGDIWDLAGTVDDTYSVSTSDDDSKFSINLPPPNSLGLAGALDDTTPGALGRTPDASSRLALAPLIGYAPLVNPLPGITTDQRGFARVAPFTIGARQALTINSVTPSSGDSTGGQLITIHGSAFTGATTAAIGGAAVTNLVVVDDTTITGIAPAGSVGDADVTVSDASGTATLASSFTFIAPNPNPPAPTPSIPASAPREVRAEAAVESAKVFWLPPASTGSFPVTSYQAVASPGGETCMVAAPALTCTITGLTPGKPYTVTARALTGAGWSETSTPSSVVVPLGPEVPTILITNSRDRAQKSMARIEGTTTGLVGAEVVPYLRIAGQADFSPGTSTRTVDAQGNFVWQRKAKKRFTVYFVSGDVTSNRLVIRPE